MVKKRGGWLAIAVPRRDADRDRDVATSRTRSIARVVLALFLPLIISSGGNSGSQASTLVIRAMALGEVQLRDWWRVMRREFARRACRSASVLGVIGFFRIVIWQLVAADVRRALPADRASSVFISLVGVVMFGTLAGSMLPFLLRKLGFDPASASAPFVATLVDVTGLVIYFTAASLILSRHAALAGSFVARAGAGSGRRA